MKKIIFLLLVLLVTASEVKAQNTSTTQMQLVTSAQFTNRLQYLMTQQAQVVLAEVSSVTGNPNSNFNYSTVCHALRTAYAQLTLNNPGFIASTSAVLISGGNYSGAVIIGTVTGSGNTADTSITDSALTTIIQNDWNTLAKCVTNP